MGSRERIQIGFVFAWFAMCALFPLGTGCDTKSPAVSATKSDDTTRPPLRVLFVGPQDVSTSVIRRWSGVSSQELDCKSLSMEEFLQTDRMSADVVVFPSRLIAEAAERNWIRPMGNKFLEELESVESGATPRFSTWPKHWRRNVTYAKRIWGIPLGVGVPLVFRGNSETVSNAFLEPGAKDDRGEGRVFTLSELQAGSKGLADSSLTMEKLQQLESNPMALDALLDRLLYLVASESVVSTNASLVFQSLDMKPRLSERAWQVSLEAIIKECQNGQDHWLQDHAQAWRTLSMQGKGWGIAIPVLEEKTDENGLVSHPLSVVRLANVVETSKANLPVSSQEKEKPVHHGLESGMGCGDLFGDSSERSIPILFKVVWNVGPTQLACPREHADRALSWRVERVDFGSSGMGLLDTTSRGQLASRPPCSRIPNSRR